MIDGTVESLNSEHGQVPTTASGFALVNDHEPPELTGLPRASVPVTVTVYFTKPLSTGLGWNVMVRVEVSYVVVPVTVLPSWSMTTTFWLPAAIDLL